MYKRLAFSNVQGDDVAVYDTLASSVPRQTLRRKSAFNSTIVHVHGFSPQPYPQRRTMR
jgi:hypothetical protein